MKSSTCHHSDESHRAVLSIDVACFVAFLKLKSEFNELSWAKAGLKVLTTALSRQVTNISGDFESKYGTIHKRELFLPLLKENSE